MLTSSSARRESAIGNAATIISDILSASFGAPNAEAIERENEHEKQS
jgi:hypothetical protein